jgi:hypothetical protein
VSRRELVHELTFEGKRIEVERSGESVPRNRCPDAPMAAGGALEMFGADERQPSPAAPFDARRHRGRGTGVKSVL